MAYNFGTIELGEGVLYIDKGEVGELQVGYVRGATFNDNIVMRHIEADGKKTSQVGDAIVESYDVTLEVTALQMESANLDKLFHGITVTDNAGIKTLTRSTSVVTGDYLTNVTFVGKTKAGKDVSIKLTNVLAEGPVNFEYADKSEVEIPVMFKANDTALGATVLPYSIIIDETV